MSNTNWMPAGRAFIQESEHLMWLWDQLWLTYKSSCPPPMSNEGEIHQLIILLISQQLRCKELYNKAIVDRTYLNTMKYFNMPTLPPQYKQTKGGLSDLI